MTTALARIPFGAARSAVVTWLKHLTRIGFVARGLLYLAIGTFSLVATLRNHPGQLGDMHRTLASVSSTTPGWVLVTGMALGLLGFAIGMAGSALLTLSPEARTARGMSRRAGFLIAGLAHVGLAGSALLILAHREPESHAAQRWAARVMALPLGREILAAAGAWALGYALFLLYQCITGRLDPLLDLRPAGARLARCALALGQAGAFARAVVYGTIGPLLLLAAWRGDASGIIGLGGALHAVRNTHATPWALVIIAVGFQAYGLFLLFEARFRRIA